MGQYLCLSACCPCYSTWPAPWVYCVSCVLCTCMRLHVYKFCHDTAEKKKNACELKWLQTMCVLNWVGKKSKKGSNVCKKTEMHPVHLSDLRGRLNMLNTNNSFVYKKAPQDTFNVIIPPGARDLLKMTLYLQHSQANHGLRGGIVLINTAEEQHVGWATGFLVSDKCRYLLFFFFTMKKMRPWLLNITVKH